MSRSQVLALIVVVFGLASVQGEDNPATKSLSGTITLSGQITITSKVPAHVAVVCPEEWRKSLTPWIDYRKAQGYEIVFVTPTLDAKTTRDAILAMHATKPLSTILLVGDVPVPNPRPIRPTRQPGKTRIDPIFPEDHSKLKPSDANNPQLKLPAQLLVPKPGVPTFLITAKVIPAWRGEPTIASDFPYSDFDNDNVPDVSIGRWAVDSTAELELIIKKTLAYEQSRDFGPWRAKLNMVAGVGGFSPIIDAALEAGARQVVLDGLPLGYRANLTNASWSSPNFPGAAEFHAATCERFNEGCLFWVYIGHGSPREVDQVRTPDGKRHHIMSCLDCGKLQCRSGAPISVFLACSTGAFDFPDDCLVEDLMREPGGPVAVVACSRVAMPYGMGVFACEAMSGVMNKQVATVGEMAKLAKTRSIVPQPADKTSNSRKFLDSTAGLLMPGGLKSEDERKEHLHLIQLFGDPLLRFSLPQNVRVAAPEKAAPGETITVDVETLVNGKAVVQLFYPNGELAVKPPARGKYSTSTDLAKEMQSTYESGLDRPVIEVPLHLNEQDVVHYGSAKITLPANLRDGTYDLRVWIEGEKDFAMGASKVIVKSEKK